ncbi:MAG: YraN family protein [Oscillospiraceae bacterium]|nr:YraN family protein [Oscillospiraceae bacterium]
MRTLGYEVLARNYRSRYGELDIIARDGEWVVFVEVKTRKDDSFAAAASAVTPSKREKMRKTASLWLKYIKSEAPARFDVIEVYAEGRINHIPHAFM